MLDTNVLISMIFFPGKYFVQLLEYIVQEHTLVLSSFVIDELMAVADKKFPDRKASIDRFLSGLSYELVYTPLKVPGNLFQIRDKNDYPVLYTAIIEGVDVFVTGDKDFSDVEIEKPEILTPAEFSTKYFESPRLK